MYALPEDFDPDVFIGQEALRICFPPFGVELHFDSILVVVYGPLSVGDESLRDEDSSPSSLARLTRLAGQRVVQADTEGRATLVLAFDAGETLRVIEDGDAYESYHLHIGGREIIV